MVSADLLSKGKGADDVSTKVKKEKKILKAPKNDLDKGAKQLYNFKGQHQISELP